MDRVASFDHRQRAPAGNKVLSTRAYNLRGQLTELDVTGPGGLTVLDRSYAYDFTAGVPGPNEPGPNLDRVIDHRDGAESRFFFYDELDRLAKATDLSGSALFTFGYDAAGNRTQQIAAGATTTYGFETGTDRLAQSTVYADTTTYRHDAFGNRTFTATSPYTGQPTHLYNDENRLRQVQALGSPPSVKGQYVYDAFGRRIKKTTFGGANTYFFHDADGQLLAEVTLRAGDTDPVRRYVFVEGELLGMVDAMDQEAGTPAWVPALWLEIPRALRPPPGMVLVGAVLVLVALTLPQLRRRRRVALGLAALGSVSLGSSCDPGTSFVWVHTDLLGTPLALTDAPALPTLPRVIWRASHEPFGKATVNENPDGDANLYRLSLRFPGQYHDAESGLHYNYFHKYDPAIGRYLKADQIGNRWRAAYGRRPSWTGAQSGRPYRDLRTAPPRDGASSPMLLDRRLEGSRCPAREREL